MRKTTVWPLCSIISNGGHVFQEVKNHHTTSKQDKPRNIQTKFGSNWTSSVRGEEFWTNVNDDDYDHDGPRRTSSDGNSSHALRASELKHDSPQRLDNNIITIYDSYEWTFSTV